MPTGISAFAPCAESSPFEHPPKDLPAFTILQKDGLDSSLPLLHINGQNNSDTPKKTSDFENPKNGLYARKRMSRSNEHLVLASLQSSQASPLKKKPQSRSQESLNSIERVPTIKSSMTLSTEDFNEVLNAKLRKIQERQDTDQGRRSGKRNQCLPARKPFITTVKTGEFLLPPPEVAALLGIAPNSNENEEKEQNCPFRTRFKPLLTLGKRPEVRHSSHNARCPVALKATVDFTLGMINATTMAASTSDSRSNATARNNVTAFPQVARALPKKLQPMEDTVIKLPQLRGEQPTPFGNVMFDRRVVRGSTCAMAPPLIDGEQSIAVRQAEARRRHLARKRGQLQATRALVHRSGSPPPVAGRKHEPVQTELFLEELSEKPDESEVATQTDYFLDRPSTPVECPVKIGQDAYTQVEKGECFDFDTDVRPILETLIGKTMEDALREVLEEEEAAAIKEQQRRFQELRDAETVEVRRLEEQERRLREEKDQRLRQHEEALKAEKENEDRVAASVLLTGYIAELLPAVLEALKLSGFLLDEIKHGVEEEFMPWLMKEVKKEVGNVVESRELLMEIIKGILENRAEAYRQLGEEYDAVKRKISTTDTDLGEADADSNFANYETPIIKTPDTV